LAERVEQVARSRIDPPLTVRSVGLLAAASSSDGYLLVAIPPSAEAPHMVDPSYWGRNDKTKYQLSDPEVARLHRLRREWERDAVGLLEYEVARDPTPPEIHGRGHFFFVA